MEIVVVDSLRKGNVISAERHISPRGCDNSGNTDMYLTYNLGLGALTYKEYYRKVGERPGPCGLPHLTLCPYHTVFQFEDRVLEEGLGVRKLKKDRNPAK